MGAPLPQDGPGTPEGSRKWASLSFYRGQGAGLPLWDLQKSPVHKSTRIQAVTHTVYRRRRAGWRWWWCDSLKKKKKKLLVPSSCHRCSFCPAHILQPCSAGPQGWVMGWWQRRPHVYPGTPQLVPLVPGAGGKRPAEALHLDPPSDAKFGNRHVSGWRKSPLSASSRLLMAR